MGEIKYHFKNSGTVREVLYPNKAILAFTLQGRDERAILLSKHLYLDGHPWEDGDQARPHQVLADVLWVGEELEFDCHVYDKGGGLGSGKDKCNFFATKAWKYTTQETRTERRVAAGPAPATRGLLRCEPHLISGTGWISELNPRKGVLTFEHNQRDERVLFLASKVYLFEKRLGAKQSLFDLCAEGDPVQFDAVPTERRDATNHFCAWFATTMWKGKKPNAPAVATEPVRRTSGDSLEPPPNEPPLEESVSVAPFDFTPGPIHENLIKGAGHVARIINDKSGVLWWLKNGSTIQSVWFESKHTFLYGSNLADQNLSEVFKENDPVIFLAETPPPNFPTKWLAKQVLVNEHSQGIVAKIIQGFSSSVEEEEEVEH
eukprot:maker-scaffold170_size291898-snap-gene-0.19 protein:Tk03007 transcript:maker-scaffold170_size291898-snap-gene-0.19-mRNA-1 annotation:"hypothetical protein L798_01356"